ncbi:MAG TPA: DUF262 domain-containing protein [Pirellulales bacterium]|nr:DUF262 domain-containing protein [Pirellulales bacterium]
MCLQDEIDKHRKDIHTDGYPMSIGELVNLYRDKELDLHPEFQRFYRWSPQQKSRWIESILLGIPLPSFFVVQRDDGVWDVIDGLQRLSTILELMGELRTEEKQKWPMLGLEGTRYLPSLEGKKWKSTTAEQSLTAEQQRYIKRAKLDIKIILRESAESAKYELFQRVNTGGSVLSEQEVRSCILISVNRVYYQWLNDLCKLDAFQACLPLTDRQKNEQYDLELASRFVVLRCAETEEFAGIKELGEFLTEKCVAQATNKSFRYNDEEAAFKQTFERLADALESDSFRRYDKNRDRFTGGFLISAYEVIGLGIGFNCSRFKGNSEKIGNLVKTKVWANPDFLTSSGVRATQRLPNTIPFGRETFRK